MNILRTCDCSAEDIAACLDRNPADEDRAVEETVRGIVADVRKRGDAAVLEWVRKLDWPDADSLVVPDEAVAQAYSQVSKGLLEAIRLAKQNLRDYHEKQVRHTWIGPERDGKTLGQLFRPVDRAGILVPGFQAPLPSSVLMNAVPAKVAGVKEIYLSTPPRKDGTIHPAIAVAAAECGVDTIFRIGGAHGVAALAYGTETVPAVDKIVGPGNPYVTTAKRLVFGQVGIEMLAGPSEVLIVADDTANAAYIAADLLSQAEHARDSRCLLVTTSHPLADEVNAELEKQLGKLSRADAARESLASGAILVAASLGEAMELVNRAAPEHLELMVETPERLLDSVRNAGAVFLGRWSTEPMGDYVAGTNHVLPTGGTARFSSSLSVDDFVKKSSVIIYSPEALKVEGPAAVELAEAEGLDAHANAVRLRLNDI